MIYCISGVLTEPMGKEIGYGDFTCYLTSNESLADAANQTKEACKAFKTEFEWVYGTFHFNETWTKLRFGVWVTFVNI